MSDETNKLDVSAAAPAVAADSTELSEESLKGVAGGSDLPKEQVSLSFSKIEWSYKAQKSDG
jgi:type VI protein secretion system component Hcp